MGDEEKQFIEGTLLHLMLKGEHLRRSGEITNDINSGGII